MDLPVIVAAGFFVVFVVIALPRWRERYEEKYEDERAFFRYQRPRMWGLVGEMAGGAESDGRGHEPGQCPVCGTENNTIATFCRHCDSRLPTPNK